MHLIFHQLKSTASASFDPMVQDQIRRSSEIIVPVHNDGHSSSAGRKCDSPGVSACHFVTVCVIQDIEGGKKKRQQAWELRQRGVWWVFLFFPLLADWDKCSNPKTRRWEERVCACAFYQLEDHWMYLLPRRSTCLVTEESKIFLFAFRYDNNH